jgi:hypothetical protein
VARMPASRSQTVPALWAAGCLSEGQRTTAAAAAATAAAGAEAAAAGATASSLAAQEQVLLAILAKCCLAPSDADAGCRALAGAKPARRAAPDSHGNNATTAAGAVPSWQRSEGGSSCDGNTQSLETGSCADSGTHQQSRPVGGSLPAEVTVIVGGAFPCRWPIGAFSNGGRSRQHGVDRRPATAQAALRATAQSQSQLATPEAAAAAAPWPRTAVLASRCRPTMPEAASRGCGDGRRPKQAKPWVVDVNSQLAGFLKDNHH